MSTDEEKGPLIINGEGSASSPTLVVTEERVTVSLMQGDAGGGAGGGEGEMRMRRNEERRERREKEKQRREMEREKERQKKGERKGGCMPRWMRCSVKDDLSPEVRFNSNWLQKWIEHGRFPWKFIFHALLAVCCTVLIFIQTMDLTPYSLEYSATWYQMFFPSDFEYQTGSSNTYDFFEIEDVADAIDNALQKYDQYPNISVNWNKHDEDVGRKAKLVVSSYKDCESIFNIHQTDADTSLIEKTYFITTDDLGPLSRHKPWNETRHFYYCMSTMWLEFWMYNIHLEYSHPIAYKWRIQLLFDNTVQGGAISLTMGQKKTRDSTLHVFKLLQLTRIVFDVIVIFLAFVSQFLSWNSLSKSFKQYQRTRREFAKRGTLDVLYPKLTWKSLPVRTKLRFFNMWFILTIIGNACNIAGAIMDLIAQTGESGHWQKLLVGLGTLLIWVNMTRYLEFDHKYVVLISTLQRGLPNAIRFIVGIAPIFIGFALFGLIYFSEVSDRFTSFGEIFVTLIGLQIGDDVQYTIRSVDAVVWVGRIYMYCFLFISIYTIANIFIAIMEEAYSFNIAVVENKKQSTEIDLNQDEGLWNAILGLDKAPVDKVDDSNDNKQSIRNFMKPHSVHNYHTFDSSSSVDIQSLRDVSTLSATPDNNNNTGIIQTQVDENTEEMMKQIEQIMEEQHARYKAETEQRIRMLLSARK